MLHKLVGESRKTRTHHKFLGKNSLDGPNDVAAKQLLCSIKKRQERKAFELIPGEEVDARAVHEAGLKCVKQINQLIKFLLGFDGLVAAGGQVSHD